MEPAELCAEFCGACHRVHVLLRVLKETCWRLVRHFVRLVHQHLTGDHQSAQDKLRKIVHGHPSDHLRTGGDQNEDDLRTKERTEEKADEEELGEIDEVLRWENAKNFTKKLNVQMRVEFCDRICPELVYVVTLHGPFKIYLYRIGLAEDTECRFCREDEESVNLFNSSFLTKLTKTGLFY